VSFTDINSVTLIGRLTRDPELRSLPSGHSVCSLRIACNGRRKDGDAYQERPNFFDVTVFGRQGETVDRYLRKGSRLAIDGRLEWSEWETAEKQRRQTVTIIAEAVQFLDSAGGRGGSHDGTDATEEEPLTAEERELVGVGAGEAQDDEIVF
jgi:single-strand DNA-binding protein